MNRQDDIFDWLHKVLLIVVWVFLVIFIFADFFSPGWIEPVEIIPMVALGVVLLIHHELERND